MLVYESPGWEWMENIRTDTFQPKIFRLKMEIWNSQKVLVGKNQIE